MRQASIAVVLVLAACHGGNKSAKQSNGKLPRARRGVKTAAPAPKRTKDPFEWAVRVTDPGLHETKTPLSGRSGNLDVGVDRWHCRYTIEGPQRSNGSTQEFGFISCEPGRTGQAAETMVLCQETRNRPTDCGTGILRINDSKGRLHQLEMSCGSPASKCPERPKIHEQVLAGSAHARATPAVAASGRARGMTSSRMGHFEWRLELDQNGGGSSARKLSRRHGDVAAGIDGWRCSYSIADQHDPNYSQLELGYTTCRSRASSDMVETVLLCAESRTQPSACNMGSLRLRGKTGPVHSIVMSCKSPSNGCW